MGNKAILNQLETRVSRLRQQISSRAETFHEMVDGLDEIIQDHKKKRFIQLFGRGDADLVQIEEHARELEGIATPLEALLASAAKIERDFNQRAGSIKVLDLSTRQWISTWAKQVRVKLARVGRHVQQRDDIAPQHEHLGQIRDEADRRLAAVDLLNEADRFMREAPEEIDVKQLKTDLPAYRQELYARVPGEDWTYTLNERLRPLRELVEKRRSERRESLQTVGSALPVLVEWAKLLESNQQDVNLLKRRLEEAESSRTEKLESLLADARQFQEKFIKYARSLRETAYADVDKLYRVLSNACPRTNDVQALGQRIAELIELEEELPELHVDWTERCKEADRESRAIAANRRDQMCAYFDRKLADVRKQIESFRRGPVQNEISQHVHQITESIAPFIQGAPSNVDDLLAAIIQVIQQNHNLIELQKRQDENQRRLVAQRDVLSERNKMLQREVKRLYLVAEDFSDALAGLDSGSLEDALERATDIEHRIDLATQQFVNACAIEIGGLLKSADVILRKLRDARIEHVPVLPAELPAEADPTTAADALQAARDLGAVVDTAVTAAHSELLRRCTRLLGRVAELSVGSLQPEQRDELAKVRAQLEEASARAQTATPPDIDALSHALIAAEEHVNFVAYWETAAQKRHHVLLEKLGALQQNGLLEFCPEPLLKRVTALLTGAQQNGSGAAISGQIAAAETLLIQLETNATRLAAAQFDDAVAALTKLQPTIAEAAARKEVERTMEAIEALTHDALPAADLRRRAVRLAGLR